MTDRTEYIEKAFEEYNAYDPEIWHREYFNRDNGGYLVVDKQRIEQSKLNKQEKEKYDKEHDMCLTLAQNGYKVEYLKITERGFDIYLNGISADLKKTISHNNILGYAKKAVIKQGAETVVFEFDIITGRIRDELNKMKRAGITVKYFTSKDKIVKNL